MQSKKMQSLFLVVALLLALVRIGSAQPAQPPADEKAGKAELLVAELFLAITNDQPAEVKAALQRGADPNGRNWLGFTSLMWAALKGDRQIVDDLLAHRAELNAASIYGTALATALVGRQEAIALHLLDKGASISSERVDKATPLMLAAGNGEMAVVKRLLAKKDSPNAQDADGATPLIYAARCGQSDVVKTLITAGAVVNATDQHGRTALMVAAENGGAECVDVLLAHKASVNMKDREGATALLLAARHNGSVYVVRSLLKAGADATLKDSRGLVAYEIAAKRGTGLTQVLSKPDVSGSQVTHVALTEERRGQAVERGLAALQTGMKAFASKMQCVSCHHQGLGMMALGTAQQHGFTVDRELIGSYLQHMGEDGARGGPAIHAALTDTKVAKTIPAVDIGDFSIGAGYILNGLAANGIPNNPGFQEMAQFLRMQQAADGHWSYGMWRGPMQSSYLTVTMLNLQIQRAYGNSEQAADCFARAKQWLLTTPTPHTEDKSSRLLGLKFAGATREERNRPLQELLAAQREDGGWAQSSATGSDAYATGMALYALRIGGELSVEDPAYQRGVQYLLRTQDEDGSWYVNKSANPANNYFDAGFPHGESQYISFAATCWATMALAQSHDGTLKASR